MKKIFKAFIVSAFLILTLCLVGCWDKVELENRGFVISLGIDKYKGENGSKDGENRYTVSMALPNVKAMASQGGNEESKSVKKAGHRTVVAALGMMDSYSSQKLYFGQTRVAVLGKEVLEDEALFREAVDALERDPEISRKLIILGTEGDASKVLEAKPEGEPLVGLFISKYYQNKNRSASAFRLDMEDMAEQLRRGAGVIPKIQVEEEEIKLGGAAVMKDYKLAGWLTEEQTRGYLWMKGAGVGTQLPTRHNGDYLTLRVDKNKAKVRFYEEEKQTRCVIEIQAEGVIDELSRERVTENMEAVRMAYEEMIRSEVMEACKAFQSEFHVDGFGFEELYKKYRGCRQNSFEQFVIVPRITVKIHGTGSVI